MVNITLSYGGHIFSADGGTTFQSVASCGIMFVYEAVRNNLGNVFSLRGHLRNCAVRQCSSTVLFILFNFLIFSLLGTEDNIFQTLVLLSQIIYVSLVQWMQELFLNMRSWVRFLSYAESYWVFQSLIPQKQLSVQIFVRLIKYIKSIIIVPL